MPAPLRAPGFRPPFCPLGDFLLIRGAHPSALPTLPPIPIVASAARSPFAPPPCPSRAAAAFLATVTSRLPSCCAAGGVQVSAPPLRTPPSARGASRASGSRPCPAALVDLAIPAKASCCCAPLAADRAAPVTHAPPCASLSGALVAWGGTRPRATLCGADPFPACATAPPLLYRGVSASVHPERPRLVPLAPAFWSPPRAVPLHGCRLDHAIPAAWSLTPQPPPDLLPHALPPARVPPRLFPLTALHSHLLHPPPRPAALGSSQFLPRPAPVSPPKLRSLASPLRERRRCRCLPILVAVLRILANGLSHRGAVRDLPASEIPLRCCGFCLPRQSRGRSLAATRFDPCLRHGRRRLLTHLLLLLLDGPSQGGPDPRGRRVGAAIVPRTARVPEMARVAGALPHVG
ncbi:unnamed protein product [Closterium sp. NIES-53]